MRKKLLLGLVLTTGLTSPALAESWAYLTTAPEEIDYADAASLAENGNFKTIDVFSGTLTGLGPDANIFYTIATTEFDCSGHKVRWIKTKTYDEHRALVTAPPFDASWHEIGPTDAAEQARVFACEISLPDEFVSNPFDDTDMYFYYYYDEEGKPVDH